MKEFNRSKLNIKKLKERDSLMGLDDLIGLDTEPPVLEGAQILQIGEVAESIEKSKSFEAPIIFAFGAHLIKNGLSNILIDMMEANQITHLLTNGASVVHDWELSYFGKTTESVKKYVSEGQFGLWDETGSYINRAIKFGSENDLGHGESIGKMICNEKIGDESLEHRYSQNSIFAHAYELEIPISVCPGIGYDITHTHPKCDGAALGKTSHKDFLYLAETLKNFEEGTFVSIGSAIMAPMVFEKALSMAKNVANQEGKKLENYSLFINDIQPSKWDWSKGEPPRESPDYYLRFFKTFSRMGGNSKYIEMDNVDFLHNLHYFLNESQQSF
jgi:deoxyhypusine synthase